MTKLPLMVLREKSIKMRFRSAVSTFVVAGQKRFNFGSINEIQIFRPVLVCFEEFKDREEVLRKAGMLKVKPRFEEVF